MYIPKAMTKAIAKNFYDKTVEVLQSNVTTDAEGGIIYNGNATVDTFKGNVSFSKNKLVKEEYGLDYDIDITITTDKKVKLNDLIKYQEIIYQVTDVLPSDSHVMLVGVKWHQQV